MDARDQREFRAHPSALADVRRWVRSLASGRDLQPSLTEELVIAVNEACTNSVLHSTAHNVEIFWKEDPNLVEVEIRDGGVFRPPAMVGPEEETGRGIPVMLAASDEFAMKK
ncbi:MAG TPA: ATP-binding protein [Actinomycetota bacterium]|nr:ATP-binding protein [Actinomycetota bacterium]